MRMWMPLIGLMALAWLAWPAYATTIYRCQATPDGSASYQDHPCPAHAQQRVLHLTGIAPVSSTPIPIAPAEPLATTPAAPSRPVQPRPPPASPPVLFRCIRATDGSTYLSRNGHPRPYLVPLAMSGEIQVPLSSFISSAGVSAPNLMPKPTPHMIGGHFYTRVQDTCHQLPPAAACAALAKEADSNAQAMHQAFRDERAPFEKRRKQLQAQMAGCRG